MSEKKLKCPEANGGICEVGMVHICKFAEDCMVTPFVYSLFLRLERD